MDTFSTVELAPDSKILEKKPEKSDPLTLIWTFVVTCMVMAWMVGEMGLYSVDSDLSYYMGVAGGVMMLVLLLYPLAKRARFLQSMVRLKYWFQYHMMLGILGPITIFFHSTMKIDSINGAVAFYSMSAVFFSGLIGRYIYTRVHRGLYGNQATVDDFKKQLGIDAEAAHSRFSFAPGVDALLQRFEKKTLPQSHSWLLSPIRFVVRPLRFYWTRMRATRVLRRAVRHYGKQHNWERKRIQRQVRNGGAIIRQYMSSIERVAQFRSYERLLSLWHYLHVPLMLLLVVSASIHVLAVHMY
ncbi:MAG: hypothetical protein IME93_07645 [Proteobacteria bacterium]|nr:hypothetical protein [Pseudomonadota bacterium]